MACLLHGYACCRVMVVQSARTRHSATRGVRLSCSDTCTRACRTREITSLGSMPRRIRFHFRPRRARGGRRGGHGLAHRARAVNSGVAAYTACVGLEEGRIVDFELSRRYRDGNACRHHAVVAERLLARGDSAPNSPNNLVNVNENSPINADYVALAAGVKCNTRFDALVKQTRLPGASKPLHTGASVHVAVAAAVSVLWVGHMPMPPCARQERTTWRAFGWNGTGTLVRFCGTPLHIPSPRSLLECFGSVW
jgi:hypothetical protein